MKTFEIGQQISGLRFPNYPLGADSPRAIVCTGTIEKIVTSDSELQIENQDNLVITIQCDNVQFQPNEMPKIDLRNGIVHLESPWIFETENEARQAYVNLVAHDLRESMAKFRAIEKRVNRIRTEHESAIAALTEKSSL